MKYIQTVTILDVGHGNAGVIQGADDALVVDCGPGSSLLEYLTEAEVAEVSEVLISHADQDHIRGLVALLAARAVKVGTVRVNSDAQKASKLWTSLLWELDRVEREGGTKLELSLTEGMVFEVQPNIKLTVLAPRKALAGTGPGAKDERGRSIEGNTISAVIQVSSGDNPVVLFTGDLDSLGLEHMLDAGHKPIVPVLVFPHHGGKAGDSISTDQNQEFAKRLCEATSPQMVIFSIGRERSENPRREIVEGIRQVAPEARIACTQLSTRCAQELPADKPSHLLPIYARGRERGRCCAGSLTLSLAADPPWLPDREAHHRYISNSVPEALCRFQLGG